MEGIVINLIIFKNSFPGLLKGAVVSLKITSLSLLIGMLGGTLLALVFLYGNRFWRVLAHGYVVIIRGTPMLVQIVTIYYVLPSFGIMLSAFWSAVIAIGFNSVAYVSQVVRAGIQAVGVGQLEAAKSLGLSRFQTIRYIILPQALRAIFPALGNEWVTLIKDSSLASVIGVSELTHQGAIIMSRTYDAITTYAGVALIYLIMTSLFTIMLYLWEQKLQYVKN